MSVEMALESFNASFRENITHHNVIEATPEKKSPFPEEVPPALQKLLQSKGIESLYSHQSEATRLALQKKDIAIVTPTASGKSLCYNLPVLSSILDNKDRRAIYLFPTKALAQDQTASINSIFSRLPEEESVRIFTYDGDTPGSIRPSVRTRGQIIITNPDMLHSGILPNHTKWTKVFEGLEYIVIDEMHMYRGVFGSHLANLLNRLLRIAAFYNASPTCIFCSATIANPGELARQLLGRPVNLITESGAPRAAKHFFVYNPPLVDHAQGIRRGVILESVRVAAKFIEQNVQTIVFARSRRNTELIASYLKKRFPGLGDAISAYRGGFLPGERRRIEKGLRDASIRCVVSTNALELGIDIGHLEAAVLAGYPGSVSSFFQQAGRAGRKHKSSAAVYVASSAPVDQYLVNHPEYLFDNPGEDAFINPENLFILLSHLKCSAFELPFRENEAFGTIPVKDALDYLRDEHVLQKRKDTYYWTDQGYPAEEVSLRSSTPGNFVIINTRDLGSAKKESEVIGEVDRASAPFILFEQAIYLHGSRQFQVESLDYDNRKAYVREIQADYYTDAIEKTDMKIIEKDECKNGALLTEFGTILVRTQVPKYKKIKFGTHENIGYGDIHLPEEEMHTESCWFGIPDSLLENYSHQEKQALLLALSTLLRNLLPVYLLCSSSDIHTSAQVRNDETGLASVFLFDRYPGGIGLARRAYGMASQLFQEAASHVHKCPCEHGCPSCIGPDEYGYESDFKAKSEALLVKLHEYSLKTT